MTPYIEHARAERVVDHAHEAVRTVDSFFSKVSLFNFIMHSEARTPG
jgi:hypothetical protein